MDNTRGRHIAAADFKANCLRLLDEVAVTDAALMTRDRQILDYAARGHLTAIAA
jgi:hypothetical protein